MTTKQKRTTRILIILLIVAIIIYSIAKNRKQKISGQGCGSRGLETDPNGGCIPKSDVITEHVEYDPNIPNWLDGMDGEIVFATDNVNPNDVMDNDIIVLPDSINDGCVNSRTGNSPDNMCTDNGAIDPNIKLVRGCTNPRSFNYNKLATLDDGSCRNTPIIITDPPPPNNNGGNNPPVIITDPKPPNNNGGNNPPVKPIQYSDCNDPYNSGNKDCKKYIWQYMKQPRPKTPNVSTNITDPITPIRGCTDPSFMSYNENANIDDGSCSNHGFDPPVK